MVEIKGTAVKDTVEAVKKRSGEHTYDKIITSLDGETRKIFERNSEALHNLNSEKSTMNTVRKMTKSAKRSRKT